MPDQDKLFVKKPPLPSPFVPIKPDFFTFGWAYHQAATALGAHFNEMYQGIPLVIAPLVFLYRHACETYIKGILIECGHLFGIERTRVTGRKHGLVEHLDDLKLMTKVIYCEVSAELEAYLKELQNVDPKGEEYRYPEDKSGHLLKGASSHSVELNEFISRSERALEELSDLAGMIQNRYYNEIFGVAEGPP